MSKLSALEKFLAKTKKLEGVTGDPFLETKEKKGKGWGIFGEDD